MRALVLAVFVACGPPTAPRPIVISDDACERAEARLRALACSAAQSPRGTGFAVVCHSVAAAGVDLHPACIATIESCSQADEASRGIGCAR
jgi:hypothetical protein